MSLNPLNDISAVYLKEVLKPQLGQKSPESSKPESKPGEDKGASSEKRVRQAVYDIRYRARREDVPLEQSFSQYMSHTSMNAVEKDAVKEKLGMGPGGSGGSVKEEFVDEELKGHTEKKFQVRVTDKLSGKTYVRSATRSKINQLRSNKNIASVEMTKYGDPYEGEKKKGEQTTKVTSGKGLDPVGKEDKDIDNDGDHDKTDKYLLNRRNKRSQAIKQRKSHGLKEGFSDWRQDLREIVDEIESKNQKEIKEKKIKNKVKINPNLPESIEKLGGQLIEMEMISEKEVDSYLEKDLKKRQKNNEKALEDMKKTRAYGDMVKSSSKHFEEVEYVEEKALSKAQQRFMGMVYATKKGEPAPSPEVAKAAASITKKEARKFAKTKHKGLPEVKEAIDNKIVDQKTPADDKVREKQSSAVNQQQKQQQQKLAQQKDRTRQQEVQILQRKLQALRSAPRGSDPSIMASYEPEGEIIDELRRSEKEGKGSPESPLSYPGRKTQKERGEKGGRHWQSGGEGGSTTERGRRKSDPYSQEQRLRRFRNYPEKSGKYSEMQKKKRGGDIGSRFD